MRLLVTRPDPQAAAWVARLAAAGFDARALPLLRIVAMPRATDAPVLVAADAGDAAAGPLRPLDAAWQGLAGRDLVVFVSPNAVAHFFAAGPEGARWPAALRAAAPGPGTGDALRAAGVAQVITPAANAAQFDSENLWQQLARQSWTGRSVLIVRGDGGRDWLAEALRNAGARVDFVQAYRRAAPAFDAAQRALLEAALARPHEHVWLFSSSEAVGHLDALAPGADWSAARAIASHPRIARRARELGCGQVSTVPPSFEAVVEAARALQRGSHPGEYNLRP